MSKHTHRGTCQACGSVQAVSNAGGRIAKHGYTVDYGFFSGICAGSGCQSVERDLTKLDSVCNDLADRADSIDAMTVADIKEVTVITRNQDRQKVETICRDDYEVMLAGGRHNTFAQIAEGKLRNLQFQAKQMRAHVAHLYGLAKARHGKDLYPVAELEATAKRERVEKASKPTKASVKRIVEDLNRAFDRDIVEPLKREARDAKDLDRISALYDLPYYLHQWRPAKHDSIVGPGAAAQIAELVEKMNEAKASLK